MGATDGHMTRWFGSYMGFRYLGRTSWRLMYDHRLAVLSGAFIAFLSPSLFPKNVPEWEENYLCWEPILTYVTILNTSFPLWAIQWRILNLEFESRTKQWSILWNLTIHAVTKILFMDFKIFPFTSYTSSDYHDHSLSRDIYRPSKRKEQFSSVTVSSPLHPVILAHVHVILSRWFADPPGLIAPLSQLHPI